MKGVVFCEFLDMVEEDASPEVADLIIGRSDLPSGGAYTSVGTYDAEEMSQLIGALSETTGTPASELCRAFGQRLFARLASAYPDFVGWTKSSLDFLEQVEDYIHREVLKLYPDAELPSLDVKRLDEDHLSMTYRSDRRLGDLAEGMIMGCAEWFGETLAIQREDLSSGQGLVVRFDLARGE